MWHIVDYIILKLRGYKSIGHVRYKNESLAPKEWKESLWTKLKNNDLIQPINISSEEHKKEFKIFVQGKVIIIALNIFLFTFVYNFIKDSYTISKAQYNIYQNSKINFKEQIPKDLIDSYNLKKNILKQYKNQNQLDKAHATQKEIDAIENWIDFVENKLRQEHFNTNFEHIKSNAFSLANDLLVMYMILKYYWKKKKNT